METRRDSEILPESNGAKNSGALLSEHFKSLKSNPNAMTVSLLLSTLVEELCCFYEHDPERRELLFRVVCDQLVEMSLLSPLAYLDELASIRARYRETLMQILKRAQVVASEQAVKLQSLGIPLAKGPANSFALRNVTSAMNSSCQAHDHFVLMPSRYQEEFEEIKLIDHGGFGHVYQARHRVDGQEYAVKKIRLPRKSSNSENIFKVLREVKVLAGLHHKHVVGYNAAWLELEGDHNSRPASSQVRTEAATRGASSTATHKLDSNLTTRPQLPLSAAIARELQKEKDKLSIRLEEDSMEEDDVVFLRTDSEPDLKLAAIKAVADSPAQPVKKVSPEHKHEKRHLPWEGVNGISGLSQFPTFKFQTAAISQTPAILFIQMELCGVTVRDWLRERNALFFDCSGMEQQPTVDVGQCNRIIKHILKGIDYIHSKELIHRDLKPRNIFFHALDNRVMIGDFGLARKDLLTSNEVPEGLVSPETSTRRLSAGVGTVTYASPEQLHGSAYDSKADMFSLGIIMYEMFSPFATEMERSVCLSSIRNRPINAEFTKKYPAHAKVIQSLLKSNAKARPSAKDILNSSLFVDRDQVIQTLSQEISQLQAALAERIFPGGSE